MGPVDTAEAAIVEEACVAQRIGAEVERRCDERGLEHVVRRQRREY